MPIVPVPKRKRSAKREAVAAVVGGDALRAVVYGEPVAEIAARLGVTTDALNSQLADAFAESRAMRAIVASNMAEVHYLRREELVRAHMRTIGDPASAKVVLQALGEIESSADVSSTGKSWTINVVEAVPRG